MRAAGPTQATLEYWKPGGNKGTAGRPEAALWSARLNSPAPPSPASGYLRTAFLAEGRFLKSPCRLACEPVRLRRTLAGPPWCPARLTCNPAPRAIPKRDRVLRGIAPPPYCSLPLAFFPTASPWAPRFGIGIEHPVSGTPVANRCATLWWFDPGGRAILEPYGAAEPSLLPSCIRL